MINFMPLGGMDVIDLYMSQRKVKNAAIQHPYIVSLCFVLCWEPIMSAIIVTQEPKTAVTEQEVELLRYLKCMKGSRTIPITLQLLRRIES